MITNEQWELIDERYGRLLAKICYHISGDSAICSFDDNLQDLRVATINAVAGFSKKEGKPFSEFWDSAGFNKYMKTCLWNLKNKKGSGISKRYNLNNNKVDITEFADTLIAKDSNTSPDITSFLAQLGGIYTDREREVINVLAQDPTYIKPSGKVNIKKLSENIGETWFESKKIIASIRSKTSLEL